MDQPAPRRRWSRFRLSTLLLLVAVAAAPLAWLAHHVQQANRQAAAVARIQQLGGTVYYDYQHYIDEGGEACIDPSRKPPQRSWLGDWLGKDFFHRAHYVRLAALIHFESPPNMTLWLGPAHVPTELSRRADQELALLERLPHLQSLDLSHSDISDDGLRHLHQLSNLRWLNLQQTSVTPEGLERLRAALPGCEVLAH